MAMLSHRLRRVLVAAPSYFQQSFTLSRPFGFITPVSSLLPRSAVKQSTESNRTPARLFSTAQYQYDPYTGDDSFTPDNEGCDFNHWLITMNFPKDNLPSRDEMVSIFEQTCAKGLGLSLEEAKKKMYAICTTSYQGFQATMTIGEVEKFRDLPGVQYIIPDSYVDVENKVYGGDKYENGVITPGPIPVPTKEGFDSLEKGQEKAQRSETSSDQGLTPGEELAQIIEVPPDQRSLKQRRGTLALGQGQGQGSRTSIPGQGQGQSRGAGSRMPSFQRSFKQSQGTPSVGQGQTQRSEMPSFQGSVKEGQDIRIHGQGQGQQSQVPSFQGSFKQGQETPALRQGQAQGSQMPSFPSGNNQGQGKPVPGQGKGQGSQIPSNQVGYSQGQGPQTPPYQGLPNNYAQGPRQGASVHYSQGASVANFVQGTPENYNQMGQGNYSPQSFGNYGPAQGAGSPGFGHGYPGHGQGQGGQLLSPYQGSYNQGQGTPLPGQGQEGQIPSYQMGYSQGLGAPVPPYQLTPGNYGHWQFVNYNQGPPHGNFLQGPQPNYNQGGQWNYSPQNGGHYGHAQVGQWHPGPPQGQGNQMPQYQLSYNHGQGTPFPGQCRCQGCGMPSYQGSYNQGQGTQIPGQWQGQGYGMPSYQASYNQGQGAPAPPYHGNYNQATPGSYGQGTSAVKPANYNVQNGGIYGPAHGSAGNPGFAQGYTGDRQNETFQQVDQRNVAGDWSNNNPVHLTDTRKPNS